jgi:hypothetical protein
MKWCPSPSAVVPVAVGVEILHLLLVEGRAFDDVFRAGLVLGHRLAAEVPHLQADEAAQVAGRDVLAVVDPVELVVELDDHALPELRSEKRIGHV